MVTAETDAQPDWAHRAKYIDHKPEWQDKIPHLLYGLGEVFFPIPAGRKGYSYPHADDDFRYHPTSETLNAYFETGWGYGIACANDLVVIDIDEKEYVKEVTSNLPSTAWQKTGSRTGVHLFYFCHGLNTREILHYKDDEGWHHLGEVKADSHGYVVGPGSIHPSGNKYGPLQGDRIAEIEKEDLLEALDEFIKDEVTDDDLKALEYDTSDFKEDSRYEFYDLTADDVFPWLGYEERISHPVHGSSTGTNFMKNQGGDTFMCWRHDYGGGQGCGLSAQHILAQMEVDEAPDVDFSYDDCSQLRSDWRTRYELHYLGWRRAIEDGHIQMGEIPYNVIKGYARLRGMADEDTVIEGKMYWNVVNAIKYEQTWFR